MGRTRKVLINYTVILILGYCCIDGVYYCGIDGVLDVCVKDVTGAVKFGAIGLGCDHCCPTVV